MDSPHLDRSSNLGLRDRGGKEQVYSKDAPHLDPPVISQPRELNRISRILIQTSCNFFSGSRSPKNSKVKRAWPGAIWGWVTDREVIPGCARVRKSAQHESCSTFKIYNFDVVQKFI